MNAGTVSRKMDYDTMHEASASSEVNVEKEIAELRERIVRHESKVEELPHRVESLPNCADGLHNCVLKQASRLPA